VRERRSYEITDAGRKLSDEHRDMVDDIFDAVREAVDADGSAGGRWRR